MYFIILNLWSNDKDNKNIFSQCSNKYIHVLDTA